MQANENSSRSNILDFTSPTNGRREIDDKITDPILSKLTR
jgi:hypothetical protein